MHEKLYEINSISYQIRIINYAIGYVLLSLDNKEDVMLFTKHEKCCKEMAIPYLGFDVNPTDNSAAKRLYGRLGYCAVGEIHLDGVYEYTDEQGNQGKYGD